MKNRMESVKNGRQSAMGRRRFLGTSLAGIVGAQVAYSAPASRPNVLFVISDDQSLSESNFFAEGRNEDGSPKNLHPNLDRLKTEGVFFSDAYCATTVCVPTRFNSMTGMHANRATNHDFLSDGGQQPGRWKSGQTRVGWNTHIAPESQSIQRILKDNGYTTGFVGKTM